MALDLSQRQEAILCSLQILQERFRHFLVSNSRLYPLSLQVGFDDELHEVKTLYDSESEEEDIKQVVIRHLETLFPDGELKSLYWWGSRYLLSPSYLRFWGSGDRFSDW